MQKYIHHLLLALTSSPFYILDCDNGRGFKKWLIGLQIEKASSSVNILKLPLVFFIAFWYRAYYKHVF